MQLVAPPTWNVLGESCLFQLKAEDLATIKGFVCGGGRVVVAANAFFNGSSTNYYLAGGGCNNTAFSTVVAHEQGHWLNQRYGTGNGNDGIRRV